MIRFIQRKPYRCWTMKRIATLYVSLSASYPPAKVTQLMRYAVFIRFMCITIFKAAGFQSQASNVYVLQSSITTVWGDWSLVEACCSLMREAIADVELHTSSYCPSPACLYDRYVNLKLFWTLSVRCHDGYHQHAG